MSEERAFYEFLIPRHLEVMEERMSYDIGSTELYLG